MRAVAEADVAKAVSCHAFHHSFAALLLQQGQDIWTIQEPLGHQNWSTTMIRTDALHCGPLVLRSPADILYRFEHVVLGPANQG